MRVLIVLALGTLISEDGTSITAGLLAGNGEVTRASAVAACAIGVYVGDLALWLAGRVLGRRLLAFPWMSRAIDPEALAALGSSLDAHLATAVLASRFLPGTRLPTYVAAGIWGRRPWAFAGWSLIAVLLWTPPLVLLTAAYGSALTSPLLGELGEASRSIVTGALLFLGLRIAAHALSRTRVT
jgi:membrane protein DedA with SNARE-associated domain